MLIYQNEYLNAFFHQEGSYISLKWLETTANMQAYDFKVALYFLAGSLQEYGASGLLIDVRDFRYNMTEELLAWRKANISPKYSAAGLKKEAFLTSPGKVMPSQPPKSPDDKYMMRFFDSEKEALRWVKDH